LSIKESPVISGKNALGVAAVAGLALSSGMATGRTTAPEVHQAAMGQASAPQVSSSGQVVAAFATYLAGLESQDQISTDGLERGTMLTLTPDASGARYRSGDVGGGWHYFVDYFAGTKTIQRAAILQFVNEHDEYADMSPICGVDFEVVRKILVQGGYSEGESLGEIGNFLAWEYSKNDITISLVLQATPGQRSQRRTCIRSIRTLG
jgi:hypothetical protein